MYNFKTKNDEHCSNNKAEYFESLIFGAKGEGRKKKWNRVKKEISNFFYNVAAKLQFSYTIYQNMPQMEFKVEISLKPDKSENYCFCYQWDGHLPVTTSQEECSCMM